MSRTRTAHYRQIKTMARAGAVKVPEMRWLHACMRCHRQCNADGISRDGLHECPRGGRHQVTP